MPSPNDAAINRHEDSLDREPPATNPREIARLARLVARGELPLPQYLRAEELQQLVREVRSYRRQRLIQFIAQAIAQDIRESLGSKET